MEGWQRGVEKIISQTCLLFLNVTAGLDGEPFLKRSVEALDAVNCSLHVFPGPSKGEARVEGGDETGGRGASVCFRAQDSMWELQRSLKPSWTCLWWGGGEDPCSKGSLLGPPSRSFWDVVFGLG